MLVGLRSSVAQVAYVSTVLLLGGCVSSSGPNPEPEPDPLDLAVRVVVDSTDFRNDGAFALDLVPSDRGGNSFVTDPWDISTMLTAPASIPLLTISQEVQPPDTQAVASAILIDNSGSMRFSDPDRLRAAAAEQFYSDILAARSSNMVALLDFGRGNVQASPGFERTVILADFTSDKSTLDAAIGQIEAVPGGNTPLYTAAAEVIAWADTVVPPGAQRTLVVITDGEPSDPHASDSLFAIAASHEVRIFAVGVGAAADPTTTATTLVRELATKTGGIYGAAESPTELEAILQTLAKSTSPSRLLVHLRLDPAPPRGTTVTGEVTLDGARGTVTSSWAFVAP